jgi:hypothetical protein
MKITHSSELSINTKQFLDSICSHYARTILEYGEEDIGTPVLSHMYDDPPYRPMREYCLCTYDLEDHYLKGKNPQTLLLMLAHVLNYHPKSPFVDLEVIELIINRIIFVIKDPEKAYKLILENPACQSGIRNLL